MNGPEIEEIAEPGGTAETDSFFLNWLQNPRSVGAVAPSGRRLAKLMTKGLAAGARVVELGAGTGNVTQAILDRGVAPRDLFIVEQNARFAAILERRFPASETIIADALELTRHLSGLTGAVDFVISGLPLMLFNKSDKRRLLAAAFSLLGADGCFYQFTYGGWCSISGETLRFLGLEKALVGIAAANIPPAFVYRIRRAHRREVR